MALAQTIPQGVGTRYVRAGAGFLRRRCEVSGHHTALGQVSGGLGLAALTFTGGWTHPGDG